MLPGSWSEQSETNIKTDNIQSQPMIFFKKHFLLTIITALSFGYACSQQSQTFVAGDKAFMLNNKPFLIRAAELHYPRIPKEYWEHRIQMCKAMGMNTICIYLFWNLHEQKEGIYNFSGQSDVVEFVKLIQKNGMYCIVRPGPYVCAEWDMGGLPWWLLKKKDIKVRTKDDAFFMSSLKRYLNRAVSLLAPYQIQNGGNIIMTQVENEYGVWGNDGAYMSLIRDLIRNSGFDKVQLFRCDWSSNFDRYNVDGVASTLNFGAGSNIDEQFKKFNQIFPNAPKMCSEYWTGWFDQWGRPHETRGINTFIGSLKDMLDRGISFSLYMAHGGTSFGQWAGANAPPYRPTVSSYDYDAPISEGGIATDKFFALRNLLKNYLNDGEKLGDIPAMPATTISIPAINFKQSASLFDNLPVPVKSVDVKTMESLDQGWGQLLYRTTIPASASNRKLTITDVHDFAVVYVDKKLIGKLDRRNAENTIVLPPANKNTQLDILIETEGRVNFGEAIIDRKGITKKVELSDDKTSVELKNWLIYKFPVDYSFQKSKNYSTVAKSGAGWYKATFNLKETGDSYLDMSFWGKGMVYVNGHNLGRFWNIGPVQTLYVPGVWLKKGDNEIIVMDVNGPEKTTITGVKKAILDKIKLDNSLLNRKPGQNLDLSASKPVATGSFDNSKGWKDIPLDNIAGRYLVIEALNAQKENDPTTSVAEIELIRKDGQTLSTLDWKILYASSEELLSSNTADKIFDNQESVIWLTQVTGEKPKHPHAVVIDLGSVQPIKAVRILPRGDKSDQGMIRDYRIYLQANPFKF